MQSFRFPIAVLGTSLVLVGALALAGGFLTRGVFAAGLGGWQAWHGGAWGDLPPELSSLRDIPPAERFAHFRGVQVNLTDKDGRPLSVTVSPGTVTAISSTAVTLNGNDGASHTFAIDSQTKQRGAIAQGQQVVVATLNASQTALAVITPDQHH